MDDYISREWLIARLGRNLAACNPGTFSEGCYTDAIETVRNAPAADVEPVKRAWWIDEEGIIVCSNCGASMEVTDSFGEENHRNYCPNCGAKMDGGKED